MLCSGALQDERPAADQQVEERACVAGSHGHVGEAFPRHGHVGGHVSHRVAPGHHREP
jgi:hypothetical protein